MNKNATILVVILGLLAVGGVIYYASQTPAPVNTTIINPPATNTPSETVNNTYNTTVTPAPVYNNAGVPTVITNSISYPTDTTVVVNGSVNPNGALASYWYEYGTSSNLGKQTTVGIVGSGFVTIGAPGYITGLAKDTTYYYRLVAENQYGRVSGNTYIFKTQTSPSPVIGGLPSAKTLSSTNVSRTSSTLNGQVSPNKSFTQYWFEYGTTTSFGNITSISSAGDGSSALAVSASLSDLKPLTTYYFRLNAQNQFGTVNGSTLNFKTTGPESR